MQVTAEKTNQLDLVWFARGYYAGRTGEDRGEEPPTVAGSALYRLGYETGEADYTSFDVDDEEPEEMADQKPVEAQSNARLEGQSVNRCVATSEPTEAQIEAAEEWLSAYTPTKNHRRMQIEIASGVLHAALAAMKSRSQRSY